MNNHERIALLIRGFRPRFGDAESIRIMGLAAKRDRLMATVEKSTKKLEQIERATGKKKQADKDLEMCESSLIHALEKFASARQSTVSTPL